MKEPSPNAWFLGTTHDMSNYHTVIVLYSSKLFRCGSSLAQFTLTRSQYVLVCCIMLQNPEITEPKLRKLVGFSFAVASTSCLCRLVETNQTFFESYPEDLKSFEHKQMAAAIFYII